MKLKKKYKKVNKEKKALSLQCAIQQQEIIKSKEHFSYLIQDLE